MVGLYLHIPFCSVKCFYCDFTAFSGQNRYARKYLEALEVEARLCPPREPSTLYIGGGTPSELSAGELEELLALIRRAYPAAEFVEATCEANPESLTKEKLEVLRRGGIDRLSLGLETADDALLKAVGRRHTWEDFLEVYQGARAMGGLAVSVDLMYGLPGQGLESCMASLDAVLALEPEHLSLYGLHVEDRTLFGKRGYEPDEALGREMFEAGLERLGRAGYRHYEISNFARPGFESRHNGIYWDDGEYVGLGVGAASHLGGARSTNVDRLLDYLKLVSAGRRPIASSESLRGREKLGETVFLGLRKLDGFELTAGVLSEFSRELDRLAGRGLIRREAGRAALTREGVFYADQVAMEFL